MKIKLFLTSTVVVIVFFIFYNFYESKNQSLSSNLKKSRKKSESLTINGVKYDGIEKYFYYHSAVKSGLVDPTQKRLRTDYEPFYTTKELAKARQSTFGNRFRTSSTAIFKERGPVNVPGRTRAILLDLNDKEQQSFFAAGVTGGIWKTENMGNSWIHLTQGLERLNFVTLASSESNPSVIYAGTGESFIRNISSTDGNGIYKSEDGGKTWEVLPSTENKNFLAVSRIVVDPSNENVLLASTLGYELSDTGNNREYNGNIMRSEDGGDSWDVTTFENTVQQIIFSPSNFKIQYASVYNDGVYRSSDAGLNWEKTSEITYLNGRVEVGISFQDPNKIYASVNGSLFNIESNLHVSLNGGTDWNPVKVNTENGTSINYLGEQGFYNNTVLVHPFDDNKVYLGGIEVVFVILPEETNDELFINVDEIGVKDFLSLTNFNNANSANGKIDFNEDATKDKNIEIRFGNEYSQKAYRFLVPEGETSGVPDDDYDYQDYIEVPFEVWDVTNNIQLMASFRDQGRDGSFNLIKSNTDSKEATIQSREYIYVHDIPYNASTEDEKIKLNGGHQYKNLFFLWPTYANDGEWDSSDPNDSGTLKINVEKIGTYDAKSKVIVDPYERYNSNNVYVHVDQHIILPIFTDKQKKLFRLLLGNDGGVFYSYEDANPGVQDLNWIFAGVGYNTSQFYGADKIIGKNQYIGGTQDNGTWITQYDKDANHSSIYSPVIGGDGFEVVAHFSNPKKMIGGSQFNGFQITLDAWTEDYDERNIIEKSVFNDPPFITRISNAYQTPDVVYTVDANGVLKSEDFGLTWNRTEISESDGWVAWDGVDVEVSKASPNIVWAGGGMHESENYKIFVSQDAGQSFSAVSVFDNLGVISGIYSHPTKENTAFLLFSMAYKPKVLKTDDLGETWTDISGFSENSTASGFPNVATYAFQAMPFDDNIMWAGTEIGIVETRDGGLTWNLIPDFPNVLVWDFKIKEGQIIIATHGRGIWTAEIDELKYFVPPGIVANPSITSVERASFKDFSVKINYMLKNDFENVFIQYEHNQKNTREEVRSSPSIGTYEHTLSLLEDGKYDIFIIARKDNKEYKSFVKTISLKSYNEEITDSYYTSFDNETKDKDFTLNSFFINTPKIQGFSRSLNSFHPYDEAYDQYPYERNTMAIFNKPIKVGSSNAYIKFDEIVLVEESYLPTEIVEFDYVVVEGSKDAINWTPLVEKYDSKANEKWSWLSNPNASMFVHREINLLDTYDVGDEIILRFRLFSDRYSAGWGWTIDNLNIQTKITSVDLNTNNSFKVFPIPAHNTLNIEIDSCFNSQFSIKLLNMSGNIVLSHNYTNYSKFKKLNIENLTKGVYLLMIEDEQSVMTQKIIIE